MNVAMIITGSTICLILFTMRFEKIEWIDIGCLSYLSALSVIQSRTAAYMIVSLFISFFIYQLFNPFQDKKTKIKIRYLLIHYFLFGITTAGILLMFFHHFFIHALTYDIKTAYVAYSLGSSYWLKVIAPFKQLGIFFVIVWLLNIYVAINSKTIRPLILFFVTWILIAVCMISRIQYMGIQHMYLIMIPTISLLMIPLCFFQGQNFKFLSYTVAFLLIFSFIQSYTGLISGNLCITYHPPMRYDMNTIGKMIDDLNSLPSDKKIYILASSGEYNQNTFDKFYFPKENRAVKNLLNTNDVDLRDGFPLQFLDADYVVVMNPVQTHLLPQDQFVVTGLAKMFLEESPISNKYRKINTYYFYHDKYHPGAKPTTAYLYEKILPLNLEDINYLEKMYTDKYPNSPDLFENRFEQYKQTKFR